jgi:hypothetical protein
MTQNLFVDGILIPSALRLLAAFVIGLGFWTYSFLYHFSKIMTDLVDHLKAQPLSEKEAALSDVSHDY